MFLNKFIKRISIIILLIISGLVFGGSSTFAQSNFNKEINYQGKLTDSTGATVANGTYNMRFWLLNSDSIATTSAEWTEELTGTNRVQVTSGLFSVMLGSTTALTGVDFNQPLYLGVEIGGTGGTPTWDGEMSPRKVLGAVPAAFEAENANTVGKVASTSLLRSDIDDTAAGLLTFTGGLISNASSTLANLNFTTATGTTLIINGESFTDFTGTALVNNAGVLSVSTSSLAAYFASTTDFDTSAELAAILTDETGSSGGGLAVFSLSPTITGTADFVSGDFSSTLTMSGAAANIALGSNYISNDGDDEGWTIDTAGQARLQTTNGGESSLWLRNAASSDGSSMSLTFEAGGTGVDVSKIQNVLRGGTDDTDLRFSNNQGGTLIEMMRLSYTGEILMGTSTGDAFLTVRTTGTKDILNLHEASGAEVFTVLENGDVGIGSSTPLHTFSVAGDTYITGALYDNANSAGSNGMVLQTTGTGFNWVATSTLGINSSLFTDGGATTYLTSSDNFGIGSTSANTLLTIEATEDTALIALGDSTNSDQVNLYTGTTSPEGRVSAPIGSLFMDSQNGALYQKTGDDNGNTSWGIFSVGTTTHMAQLVRATATTAPSVTSPDQPMDFDTVTFDQGGLADTSLDRITIKRGGKYFVQSFMQLPSLDAGERLETIVYKNDVDVVGSNRSYSPAANQAVTSLISNVIELVAGDYITFKFTHNEGADLTTPTGIGTRPTLTVTEVGRVQNTGGNSLFTDAGVDSYLTDEADNLLIGTSTNVASAKLVIRQQSASDIVNIFDGSTEVFSILDGGNVGIGTTTPSYKLSVVGDTVITGALRDNNYSAGSNGMVLQTTGTGFAWVATSTLGFASSSALANYLPLTGGTLSGNLSLSDTAANIALGSNWLSGDGEDEGISVDSTGRVGIGTTSPSAKLDVWGNLQVGTSSQPTLSVDASTQNVGILNSAPSLALHVGSSSVTDSTNLLRLEDANSTCNFNADTGSPSCGSDITLKKDIDIIENELERIVALEPSTWRWKTDSSGAPLKSGFIAQEVEKEFPDLVTESLWVDGTTRKFLNVGGLMPYVVGAVKEQQETLEEMMITGSSTQGTSSPFYMMFDGVEDTIWEKIVNLAQGFGDGVLKLVGIETEILYARDITAETVTTEELCIGSTCVTEAELQNLLQSNNAPKSNSSKSKTSSQTTNENSSTSANNSSSTNSDNGSTTSETLENDQVEAEQTGTTEEDEENVDGFEITDEVDATEDEEVEVLEENNSELDDNNETETPTSDASESDTL